MIILTREFVIPAQAGIYPERGSEFVSEMDPRLFVDDMIRVRYVEALLNQLTEMDRYAHLFKSKND